MTALNLGWNSLSKKTGAELAAALAAIPAHVKQINLQGNHLFKSKSLKNNKSPKEINDLLETLGEQRARLDLRNNGESEFARAAGPLAQIRSSNLFASKKKVTMMPEDLAKIASYLGANPKKAYTAIKQTSKKVLSRKNEETQKRMEEELEEIKKSSDKGAAAEPDDASSKPSKSP